MAEKRIADHLVEQFKSSWEITLETIDRVPDEKWTDGIERIDKPWSETEGMNVWYFCERVYHIIQTVEFYAADSPESMKWGGRIGGIDWKSESPEETAKRITKDMMHEYLEETKRNLENKLRSFSDDEYFETDGFSRWQTSRLSKFIYVLRHSMWHLGELSRALREYACEHANWR
ncbi:MAG: hypothetical protein ACFFFK_08900 [Candidatus Thorarchaeota archaeon]